MPWEGPWLVFTRSVRATSWSPSALVWRAPMPLRPVDTEPVSVGAWPGGGAHRGGCVLRLPAPMGYAWSSPGPGPFLPVSTRAVWAPWSGARWRSPGPAATQRGSAVAAAHVAGRLRWVRGLATCLWPCVLPTWPGFPSCTARAPRPPWPPWTLMGWFCAPGPGGTARDSPLGSGAR